MIECKKKLCILPLIAEEKHPTLLAIGNYLEMVMTAYLSEAIVKGCRKGYFGH